MGRGLEPPSRHARFAHDYLANTIITLLDVGQLEQGVQQTHNMSLEKNIDMIIPKRKARHTKKHDPKIEEWVAMSKNIGGKIKERQS